ncbi:hypothetical protein K438DRAFT_1782133 [Mycena galopus ATCC 62051]|nr:hypothetical protein K438DRAFT_1782133 [Mycena galopus ATCC 62051]
MYEIVSGKNEANETGCGSRGEFCDHNRSNRQDPKTGFQSLALLIGITSWNRPLQFDQPNLSDLRNMTRHTVNGTIPNPLVNPTSGNPGKASAKTNDCTKSHSWLASNCCTGHLKPRWLQFDVELNSNLFPLKFTLQTQQNNNVRGYCSQTGYDRIDTILMGETAPQSNLPFPGGMLLFALEIKVLVDEDKERLGATQEVRGRGSVNGAEVHRGRAGTLSGNGGDGCTRPHNG